MIQVIRDIAKYRIKKKAIKIALFLVKQIGRAHV